MKAFLIDPATQTISQVDISNRADIAALIGFDTLESDELDAGGDRLWFDEECFIRGAAVTGRFQIDSLVPVAGKGIVIGGDDSGDALVDVTSSADALATRVKYL